MGLADPWAQGGTTGKKPKKPKTSSNPADIASLLGHSTSSSAGSSGGVGPQRYSYGAPAPQPIRTVTPSPLRRDPGRYSVNETAWGASAFSDTSRLRDILPRLRSRLGDEQSFNSLLSQLMTNRWETYQDRLDRQFDRDRATYQQQLDEALDAQREGLPYDMPEMPDVPHVKRGQGQANLLETFADSIKPGMPQEVKDAYSNFYKYELTRLLDFKGDVRNQRNSLRNYRDQYKAESGLIDTRDQNDAASDGYVNTYEPSASTGPTAVGNSNDQSDSAQQPNPIFPQSRTTGTSKPSSNEPVKHHDWSFLAPSSGPQTGKGVGDLVSAKADLEGLLTTPENLGSDKDRPGTEHEGIYSKFKDLIGAPDVPGTDILDGALNKIMDESADPLMWAIDKLSRPLYGVNTGVENFYNLDKDNHKTDVLDGMFLAGKNPLDSIDELVSDPLGSIGSVWSGYGEGISGQKHTLFGEVIKNNAERDGGNDFTNNGLYQIGAGLVGDIALDPLSYVGLGISSKVPQLTMEAAGSADDVARMRKASEEAADLLNSQHVYGPMEEPVSADEIFNLAIGGKAPTTAGERSRAVTSLAEANMKLARLTKRLADGDYTPDMSRFDLYRRIESVVQEQRAAMLKDFEGSTVVDGLRRDLEIKVRQGKTPASELDEFNDLVSSSYLKDRLIEANYHRQYLEKAAEKIFNTTASKHYVDDVNKGSRIVTETRVADSSAGKTDNVTEGIEGTDKVRVNSGGTTARAVGTKRSAWENVERSYEAKRSHYEKLPQSHPEKAARKKDLEAMAAKMQKVMEDAPNRPLSESMPELVRDYRLTPEQVDNLYADARKLARTNPEYRRLEERSLALHRATQGGNGDTAYGRESALKRKAHVDRQKERILGVSAVQVLKSHFANSPVEFYTDTKRATEIKNEIRNLRAKSTHAGSVGNDIDVQDQIRALQDELHDLSGFNAKPQERSLMSIPERFITRNKHGDEASFNMEELRKVLRINLNGKSEYYRQFEIVKGLREKDPTTFNWLHDVKDILQQYYEPEFAELSKPAITGRKSLAEYKGGAANLSQADNAKYSKDISKAASDAADRAFKRLSQDIFAGTLKTLEYSDAVRIKRPLGEHSTEKELLDALRFKFGEKEAALKQEKYVAQRTKNDEELARIDARMKYLRDQRINELNRQKQLVQESRQASRLMSKRLREEALLYTAKLAVPATKKQISLRMLGSDFAIPHTEELFRGVEKMSGLPLIKQARQAYADAFKSPAASLTEDMRLARDRALGRTPAIIEHHINELKRTVGSIPERDRIRIFGPLLSGHGLVLGESHQQDAIIKAFDDILPYFNGKSIGEAGPLSLREINRWLPDDFKIDESRYSGIDTLQDLVHGITRNKKVNKADRTQLKDPYRLSWALRLAVEQASSRKAMEYTISSTFGVKDLRKLGKDFSGLADEFHKLGWRKIPAIGNNHLFPPEIIPDIHKMLDMLEPRNLHPVGKAIDRATGYWKTATTLYNPGYYTRNGIGEIMSSWLAGVQNPKWYASALQTMKYARGDGKELEALKSQYAMLDFMKSDAVDGSGIAFRMKDGTPVTHAQVWVAYNDAGLKTGFFNTEFNQNYSKAGALFRNNEAGQLAGKMHSRLRSEGEWYEDYLRMAHFQYALQNSGAKTLEGATRHAAAEVRKYHFDYTDFTNFEKTVMLRAFPFYKWTRKAMPLMATMLFTKPGKVMAPMKVQNAMTNAITTQDIAADNNGFAPNYGDIVPGWIQDMWAYQIMGDPDEGNQTYLNMNLPTMAAYSAIQNPGSTSYGMLNPLIKAPLETGQIITNHGDQESFLKKLLAHDLPDKHTDMHVPLQEEDESMTHAIISNLLKMTPQGAFTQKDKSNQDIFNFLTGIGTYANNDKRRMGELMSRQGQ